ncbi:MAG: hypothetical protein U0838_07920 [Chloroflexota bacterium]
MPLVLASSASAALGLVVIAPAIGTRLDTPSRNAATVVLALGTGALVPPSAGSRSSSSRRSAASCRLRTRSPVCAKRWARAWCSSSRR